MILGITGGTGCGKTTLLQLIAGQGGVIVDCDDVYHHLLETDARLLSQIAAQFPGAVEQGALQRKKLGALVFADPQALAQLNRITHQAVAEQVERMLTPRPALAAIDAIALFESGLDRLCDVTVAITAPTESRVQRLVARDGIQADYARRRIAAQHPQSWFQTKCTYTLDNSGTPDQFHHKCLAFLRQLGIIEEEFTPEGEMTL